MSEMDEIGKYRLLGAAIWLTLLILIVPGWYSHPVNFKPEGAQSALPKVDQPLVGQAYVLPAKTTPPTPQKVLPKADEAPEPALATQAAQVASPDAKTHAQAAIKPSAAKPSSPQKEAASAQTVMKGQWLVKVASYKELKKANDLLGRLDRDYAVWIKEFPKSKTYSVRTGPYATREAAQRDKQKIDKAFHTQAIVEQVK